MNFKEIESSIAGKNIKIVAVTKNRSAQEVKNLISAGVKIIGENRVQEAKLKFTELGNVKVEKHLIGHLQRNKVKNALEIFDVIQSVDSLRLIEKIEEEAKKIGKVISVYLQINVANDKGKFGFQTDEVNEAVTKIKLGTNIQLKGVMIIGGLNSGLNEVEECFKKAFKIFEIMKANSAFDTAKPVLSMGMSNDYKIAIRCGSNMLRLGSILFENN